MRALLGSLTAVLLLAGLASAATDDKPHSSQAEKMKTCNAEAHDKHLAGDERKHFMSECLKGHGHDASHPEKASQPKGNGNGHGGQAEKMKTCNQEAGAKNLHGDERRHFMSECLKGDKKS